MDSSAGNYKRKAPKIVIRRERTGKLPGQDDEEGAYPSAKEKNRSLLSEMENTGIFSLRVRPSG